MSATPAVAGGRYHPIRSIGAGGMGTVLLARDGVLDRLVALKMPFDQFAADPVFRARFEREARLAARLSHPNVVAVFDAGEDAGRPYLVMEYIEGEPLSALLARRGPLPPGEASAIGVQLAAGLAHAHALGVVHRDVKPHNVLIRADGTAKLTDFGIARAVDALGLTDAGTVAGTAAYMAPEQALGGEASPPADVYAFGAVLHEILTGVPPARPAAAPGTPLAAGGDLAALVGECLRSEPADRPAATEVGGRLSALASAASPAPAEAAPTTFSPPAEAAPTTFSAPVTPAETVVAPRAGDTEVLPPGPPGAPVSTETPQRRRRRVGPAAVLASVAAGVILAVSLGLGDGGEPEPPAPVPEGATAADDARNLADWLRSQSE